MHEWRGVQKHARKTFLLYHEYRGKYLKRMHYGIKALTTSIFMIVNYKSIPAQIILHELFSAHYNFMKQVPECILLSHFMYKKTDDK